MSAARPPAGARAAGRCDGGRLTSAPRLLTLDVSDNDEGIVTIEALASTSAAQHAQALAEAQRLLDWAWREFPHTHGPADEGGEWDHDLQVHVEADGWHAVSLTLAGTPAFAEAFVQAFGERPE